MKRFLTGLLVCAIIGEVSFAGWRRWHPRDVTDRFITAVAARGNVTASVTATGQLQPVVSVQVGSQVSGLIKELPVDFNSKVTAGEVIARLDREPFVAEVHSADGTLAGAKSDLHAAQLNAQRTHELSGKALVAQSDVDAADSAVEKNQAVVAVAQAALEKAQLDLSHCTVTSPVDGVVTSRNVDVGQTVAASLSAPTLFTIAADLTKMQIIAEVAEGDIGQVRAGEKTMFSVDAYPGRTFTGTVEQVRYAPRTIDSAVNYDTVINVGNNDLALLPGMTANTTIVVAEHDDVVLVPNAALRFQLASAPSTTGPRPSSAAPGSSHKQATAIDVASREAGELARTVYTLSDTPPAKPVLHHVGAGISDGQMTEIVAGISVDDRVVVSARGAAPAESTHAVSVLSGAGSQIR